jgi:hypothetical protein
MALPPEFNFTPVMDDRNAASFPAGVTVSITMQNGTVYTGELIDGICNYILTKLTVSQHPYVAGQIIRVNKNKIMAVG